jgi:hypothetical protein
MKSNNSLVLTLYLAPEIAPRSAIALASFFIRVYPRLAAITFERRRLPSAVDLHCSRWENEMGNPSAGAKFIF